MTAAESVKYEALEEAMPAGNCVLKGPEANRRRLTADSILSPARSPLCPVPAKSIGDDGRYGL